MRQFFYLNKALLMISILLLVSKVQAFEKPVTWDGKSDAVGLMMHISRSPFRYDFLYIMRKQGSDLFDEGLRYLKEGELTRQETAMIMRYAIDAARFHKLEAEDIDYIRGRYLEAFNSELTTHSLWGVAFFYDDNTLPLLKDALGKNPELSEEIEQSIKTVEERSVREKKEPFVPYFSEDRSPEEIEVIYCAGASFRCMEGMEEINNYRKEHLGVPEVKAGIALFHRTSDQVLKVMVRSVLMQAAKNAEENEELVRLVEAFSAATESGRISKREAEKVKPRSPQRRPKPLHAEVENQSENTLKNQVMIWFVAFGAGLALVWLGFRFRASSQPSEEIDTHFNPDD